jgi:hypothetical protein
MSSPHPVPERLAAADRVHQREAGGSLLLRSVKYLCAALLGLFVCDVALHLGAGWRLGLVLALLGVVVVLALTAGWLAFLHRNRLEQVARRLESRDPSLGSKLINILQLRGQAADARLDPQTRRLAQVAVDSYAETLMGAPLEQLARTGELRRQFVRAAWAGAVFLAVLAGFFRITAVSKRVSVGVILTPQLDRAFVRITPPAYTGLPAEEKPYAFKAIHALAGSSLRFALQSNRPLREGRIELTAADQPPRPIPLTTNAENQVAAEFPATESARLRFSLTDATGIPAAEVWEGTLTVTHDLPPEIHVAEPERDCFVAIDFPLRAHFDAADDYGLSTLRLHRAVNGVWAEPELVRFTNVVRESRAALDLDFARLGLKPGDVLAFFGEAIDTRPDPQIARSQTVTVTLISVEDYNNFIRRESEIADLEAKYGALQDDLGDLINQQRQLAAAADTLRQQIEQANPARRDDLLRSLDDLLARQNELNQRLDQHADRLDHFVRDLPVYDIEKEIEPLLKRQAEAIRNSTRTNAAAARDIAQRSAPPTGPRQLQPGLAADYKRAAEDQIARLTDSREQAEAPIAQTLEEMQRLQELIKDFNQFQALFETQQALVQHASPYNKPGELDREAQLALKDLGATEKQVDDLLGQLETKLRDDADAADDLFPKAAQSARDLADKIAELRLQPLARQATGALLAGTGDRAFRIADRLRGEMEKLFAQCQGGNCPGAGELDSYLRLQRGLKPGNNFAQMAQSRRFGSAGLPGQGQAEGEGSGAASGYAEAGQNRLDVRGNELAPNRGHSSSRDSSRIGRGKGELAGGRSAADTDKTDALKGLKPVNRQSGAVTAETPIEEYHDVVDSYFKAIATGKKGSP